jgi:predicted RecB family nuclease
MTAPAPIRLSKSKFVSGIQCLKRLYLQVHSPELAGEVDEGQLNRLEQGQEVGKLAQKRFSGGVLVSFDNGADDALAKTAALIDDTSVPAIFEATFQHSNMLVRVDILQRLPNRSWRLIEVKSSLDVKPHYLYDLAIQYHVLTACGMDVSEECLMHLNRDYIYDGRQYDVRKLFRISNETSEIEKLDADLAKLVRSQRKALAQPEPPDIAAGRQCTDPYACEFLSYCNPEPPEDHISFLPGLRDKKRNELCDLGVTLIPDIPDNFPLTENQHRAWKAVVTRRPWMSKDLGEALTSLKSPLYFMDFESVNPALPRHARMWPYAQLPFQWSVHRLLTDGGELEHFEFLADDDQDPRERFLSSLCDTLGSRGKIVVYNAGFERQRLQELAGWLPNRQARIDKIQQRLWDLHPIIKKHVYHRNFRGSFSLKAVVDGLVPAMSYKALEVSDGSEAGLAWDRLVRGNPSYDEGEHLKSILRKYCRRDTLAMVKILERLRSFCR